MTKEQAEEVLGLPERYTRSDLRKSYASLAREYHPDVAERRGHSRAEAERHMADINVAFSYLQGFFDDGTEVVERGVWGGPVVGSGSGIEHGFGTADWRAGTDGAHANRWGQSYSYAEGGGTDGFWDFVADEQDAPPEEKVPVTPRTVLLGPVVPRVAAVVLFAWVWWRTCAFLPRNAGAYAFPGRDFAAWARLAAATIYPTYLVVYEAITGNVSGLVRGVLNGAWSWLTRRYYDLRARSATYGCSLSKLLRDQIWALLMLPVVLWLAGRALVPGPWGLGRIASAVLAVALGIDTLAACVHAGLVNTWTTAAADRVEAWYLVIRRRLLIRCGQWRGR